MYSATGRNGCTIFLSSLLSFLVLFLVYYYSCTCKISSRTRATSSSFRTCRHQSNFSRTLGGLNCLAVLRTIPGTSSPGTSVSWCSRRCTRDMHSSSGTAKTTAPTCAPRARAMFTQCERWVVSKLQRSTTTLRRRRINFRRHLGYVGLQCQEAARKGALS